MSSTESRYPYDECVLRICVNCRRSPEDGFKLLKCTGCVDAPTYCSKECQKAHRPMHKGFCKYRDKRFLAKEPWNTPEHLHSFDSLEELTRTFNEYTRAHGWALETVVKISTLLRYDFGRIATIRSH
ncbi:hypothetical protein LXA43DRAFT_357721 [Ganoderma leucocontextum]|nr:hypothetical protein LXA43DRAFT_357721 [Ganoderma leucocontextum]